MNIYLAVFFLMDIFICQNLLPLRLFDLRGKDTSKCLIHPVRAMNLHQA